MIIKEKELGVSDQLLFPKISSCTAVVACMQNTLIGAHFVADPWTGGSPREDTKELLDSLRDTIKNPDEEMVIGPIGSLLIVGFNQYHQLQQLVNGLEVDNLYWEAYDINRKGISELTLIFTFQGANLRAKVDYKRQSKVNFGLNKSIYSREEMDYGKIGSATIGKLHTLRKHFVIANNHI